MPHREHRRRPWRKLFASMAGIAVAASTLVAVDNTVNVTPAYADTPMYCNGDGVYTQNSAGQIREFRATDGVFTPVDGFNVTGQQNNALDD